MPNPQPGVGGPFISDRLWPMLFATTPMRHLINLEKFPLDRPESHAFHSLQAHCRDELSRSGSIGLHGFLKPEACRDAVNEVAPILDSESFTHWRKHNVYFLDDVPGVDRNHPALKKSETINHTVCADQLGQCIVTRIYEYPPLVHFLAGILGKSGLFTMDDPLARVNVMAYRQGEALNWHFDRSEFTVTLLLQSPRAGGHFEYRPDLRSDQDPNYDGVARLLADRDPGKCRLAFPPGTLNIFRGRNTAHRLTPVEGNRDRIIAVFSYYEFQGKRFSEQERLGFYGRTA